MEAIAKLIQMGYNLNIDDYGDINCTHNGKTPPAETEVVALWEAVTAGITEAMSYLKTLVRLDVLVVRINGDVCVLELNAYDINGRKVPELNVKMFGTDEEIGAFLWKNYFESPMFIFIHGYAKGEMIIAYLSRILVPIAATDLANLRYPW